MPYEWTPERIAKLKELRQTGVSARDISKQLGGGITRNAVIGKANRLGIPISGEVKPNKKDAKKNNVNTEAPTRKKCQWPIGDPAENNFYFCEKPTFEARPYCKEHCIQAYRRVVTTKHVVARTVKQA